MVVAVVLAVSIVLALRTPAFVSALIGFPIGVAVAQLRWVIWRWRHPVISRDQYIEDLRQRARWN